MGCEEGSHVTWIVKSKVSQLPFWCFAVLILKTELPPLAATCLVLGRGGEGRRGDGEGSNEPSVLEGSLAAGGGHSGWGPAVHFARLATRLLLPHGLQSQVTGDDAGGGHSGWGPAVHFARLATRLLLPHGLQSQVTGDDAGGGHSGWGPAVRFARLATRLLLPHGLQSQVTGDDAGGGLGRL